MGLTITYTLQALSSAQTTAAHTHEVKLAREMALRTLGEISTGRYQAEMNDVIQGSYPEDVAPYMRYQIAFGEATLPRHGDPRDEGYERETVDNWENRRRWEDEQSDDEEDTTEEDYEIVKIRVIFPKHSDELDDFIELEAWIPWDQVYGAEDENEDEMGDDRSGDGDNTGDGGPTNEEEGN